MSYLLFGFDANITHREGGVNDLLGVYKSTNDALDALKSQGIRDDCLVYYAQIYDTTTHIAYFYRMTHDSIDLTDQKAYTQRGGIRFDLPSESDTPW